MHAYLSADSPIDDVQMCDVGGVHHTGTVGMDVPFQFGHVGGHPFPFQTVWKITDESKICTNDALRTLCSHKWEWVNIKCSEYIIKKFTRSLFPHKTAECLGA